MDLIYRWAPQLSHFPEGGLALDCSDGTRVIKIIHSKWKPAWVEHRHKITNTNHCKWSNTDIKVFMVFRLKLLLKKLQNVTKNSIKVKGEKGEPHFYGHRTGLNWWLLPAAREMNLKWAILHCELVKSCITPLRWNSFWYCIEIFKQR